MIFYLQIAYYLVSKVKVIFSLNNWRLAICVFVPLITLWVLQIVTSSYTDLQDYTYYFVPAPWLCVKLLKLLQLYPPPGESLTKRCTMLYLSTV